MTRERAPRPGAHWQQQTATCEVVVPDDPYGCRHCELPADGHGTRYHHRVGLHQWQGPTVEQVMERSGTVLPRQDWVAVPTPPSQSSRRQRRDQQHANRKKGHR